MPSWRFSAASHLACLLLCAAPALQSQSGQGTESIRLTSGSLQEFIRASRARLNQPKRPHFLHVTLYGPKGGHPLPIPAGHLDYDYWRNLHQQATATPNEIGELVAIGPNAVLRVRDQSQKLSRIVLEGSDPLLREVKGNPAEILYIAYSGSGPFQLHGVIVFVQAAPTATPNDARELFEFLEPIFPAQELSLNLRPDPWFIFSPHYPFANPFVQLLPAPSESDYNQSPTIRCARHAGALHCR